MHSLIYLCFGSSLGAARFFHRKKLLCGGKKGLSHQTATRICRFREDSKKLQAQRELLAALVSRRIDAPER